MKTVHLLLPLALFMAVSIDAAPIVMPLPNQNSTFSGSVRGYWFTAPTDFRIVGLHVPTDASSGNQSIEVVRLNAPPPLYSTVTNDFSSLFRVANSAAVGFIPVDISVSTGDIIGILGYRGTTNSYGAGNFATNIFGQSVTLRRLGMQFPLTTTAARDLWTESGGSMSRIEMQYDAAAPAVPEPTTYAMVGGALACLVAYRRKRTN